MTRPSNRQMEDLVPLEKDLRLPSNPYELVGYGLKMFGIMMIPITFSILFYLDNKETSRNLVAEMKLSNAQFSELMRSNMEINVARAKALELLTGQIEEGHSNLGLMSSTIAELLSSVKANGETINEGTVIIMENNNLLREMHGETHNGKTQ